MDKKFFWIALFFTLILFFYLYLNPNQIAQENLGHMGCQEREINNDEECILTEENNAKLFGQNFDEYVDFKNVKGGFLAKPKEEGEYPGVIMIHEWWGLNNNIKEMAKLLAKEGYIVYAVDLYGDVATESDRARELSSSVRQNSEKTVNDMKIGIEYLRQEGAEKIASIGWCFGGQQSLLLSLNEPLDATVIYYGQLIDDKEQLRNINGPVLGIFGEDDSSITVESVNLFESVLNDLGIENNIYIYPGVGHAFANPSGSNYAAKETVDAWEKTIKFLDDSLRG